MKIEEYASTIYDSEKEFRTGPELIAKGIRIGLKAATRIISSYRYEGDGVHELVLMVRGEREMDLPEVGE